MRNCLILLFAISAQFNLLAQDKAVIKNLVFEGGGIRGIAYCGSIIEMESQQMMERVERVGGTSAGAVTALTLALGYSGKEIQEIISSTNFKKFNDGRYLFVGGINRTNKYFGWYRGNRVEKWLEQLIEAKTGDGDISFEEFYQKGFKDLYITGTCLNKQQLVIFSRYTYPQMKIKDAVKISMSVPIYFEAVFINSNGKVIRRPKNKDGLDVMVDGGIIANFPIRIFDSTGSYLETLGFRIDSEEQILNDRQGKNLAEMPVQNFNQYLAAFYNIVIENLNRQQLTKTDWQRTVSISDGSIGPRIRKLSEEEVSILIDNGREAVKHYISVNIEKNHTGF